MLICYCRSVVLSESWPKSDLMGEAVETVRWRRGHAMPQTAYMSSKTNSTSTGHSSRRFVRVIILDKQELIIKIEVSRNLWKYVVSRSIGSYFCYEQTFRVRLHELHRSGWWRKPELGQKPLKVKKWHCTLAHNFAKCWSVLGRITAIARYGILLQRGSFICLCVCLSVCWLHLWAMQKNSWTDGHAVWRGDSVYLGTRNYYFMGFRSLRIREEAFFGGCQVYWKAVGVPAVVLQQKRSFISQ